MKTKYHLNALMRSFVCGFPLGFLVSRQISMSYWAAVLAGLVCALIVLRTRDAVAPVAVIIMSASVTSLAVQINGRYVSDSSPFVLVVVVFISTVVVVARLWGRRNPIDVSGSVVVLNTVLCLFLWWITARVPWSGEQALAWISVTHEDNGSWLDGVARTLENRSDIRSSELLLNGSTGSVAASLVAGYARSTGSMIDPQLDSAILTLRLYWVLTVFGAVLAAHTTMRLLEKRARSWAVIPSMGAALGSILFMLGMHEFGHFTALLAAVVMTALIYFVLQAPFDRVGMMCMSVALMWAIGNSWYSLHAWTVVVATLYVFSLFTPVLSRSGGVAGGVGTLMVNARQRCSPVCLLAVGGVVVFAVAIGLPIVRSLLNVSNIVRQLSLGGGHPNVHPYLAVGLYVVSGMVAGRQLADRTASRFFSIIVLGSILFVSSLVAIGFVISPYEPQYGALKSLHLIGLSLTSVAIAGLTLGLSKLVKGSQLAAFLTGIAVVLGALTYMEPYPKFMNVVTEPQAKSWVPAAVQELRARPNRLTLCLDTRGENWGGYSAYVCSRLLAGVQGKTTEWTNAWTAANACLVNSERITEFPPDFWENLTLLVTDTNRLVSSVDCDGYGWAGPDKPRDPQYPIGWLSGVQWRWVRVVGPDGRQVKKTFEYLRTETGFTDEVVNDLERSLRG
jgi:hypothetical protein